MKKRYLLITLFSLSVAMGWSQDMTGLRQKQFNIEKGIAINGYDPVSYFNGKEPVKGSKDLAVYFQGITYYFSSTENKDLFKKNPAQYEPQYGGWCAYAMGAKGEKVEVDPKTYKIIGGKLYLFYNHFFNNTLTDWNKDEAHLKQQADLNWIKLYK